MIDIRSIRVRDTPVGALVDCRRSFSAIAGIRSLLSTRAPSVTVFSSVLRELFPHTPASSWLRHSRSSRVRPAPLVRWLLENCRASTSIFSRAIFGSLSMNEITCSFQANKSQRWMPWRQEPMKDVSDCEKLRGAVY